MIERFFNIQKEVEKSISLSFQRYLMTEIDFSERLIGIVGARGTGKTTLLLQHYKKNFSSPKECLYISADNIYVISEGLFSIAEYFFRYGGKTLLVDEIHKYPNWAQELKNIYDSFPSNHIVFSGSSMLDIVKGKADLSRRAVIYNLKGLSFREYLGISGQVSLTSLELHDIVEDHVTAANDLAGEVEVLKYFQEYLKKGYYPYFIESSKEANYYNKLNNAVEKILYEDIPSVFNIKVSSIPLLKRLIYVVASSFPFQLNIDGLSSDLKTSRETLYLFIEYLEKAGIFNLLYSGTAGKKIVRKPLKIYLENSNLIYLTHRTAGFEYEIGTVREAFFLNQVKHKHRIFGSSRADFIVDEKYVFEVGGRSKKAKQVDLSAGEFLVKDGIEIGSHHIIPLWLFGLLY
ncbi:MAG: ATP-binding protein [Candidatus Aminicenantes bacterium]|nr:ATP-binding protein [Candidatus Aminicenantes bacterium]